ncbi:quinon protein alcohol dehydrogenase-like superfamily [Glomus cerebriforme]|uniref:Quinon protein alcohol dehydrogenase-like superfamily n=1 Tax=Glomus cerebriforme TaxID=658196 RepID=A0A397TSA0_9GLOM|nr:quinon protein alcohol dehydrogenase-like superfamily [Glomus cerebriforme]
MSSIKQKQLAKNNTSKNTFAEKSPGQIIVNKQKSNMIKPQQPNSKKPNNFRSARNPSNPSHEFNDSKKSRIQKNHNKDTKRKETVKLEIQRVLGGRFIDRPVVFSKDSKYFFCCCSNSIKVASVKTGDIFKTFSISPEMGGHKNDITFIRIDPNNVNQLYSASLDGIIKLWNCNSTRLVKEYCVGLPILRMEMHEAYPNQFFIVTSEPQKIDPKTGSRNKQVKHALLHIKFDEQSEIVQSSLICKSNSACTCIEISENGDFLVITFAQVIRVIDLKSINNSSTQKWPKYKHPNKISCVAINSHKGFIAIGDLTGKITYWYCLEKSQLEDPVTSEFHWHAHKVNSLVFSSDGNYLISGGEEGVLSIWRVEDGYVMFVPRLGAEVINISISPDQTIYAVGLLDNSIKLISMVNYSFKQALQGLKYESRTNPLSTGLVLEPRNHDIVLNGRPGTIQFYNAYMDRHVMELEVSVTNRVSRIFEEEIVRHHVKHVCFSKNGKWMATVDARNDGVNTPELYLKFWHFDSNSQNYQQNCRVDCPHYEDVLSLCFHSGTDDEDPIFITTGLDTKFKIWQLNKEGDDDSIEAVTWTCGFIGSYKKFIPRMAAVSKDGTVLAVSFNNTITLWDAFTFTLKRTLQCMPSNENVKNILFTNDEPFLVSTTDTFLYVWNILTCEVLYRHVLEIEMVALDPNSSDFVVAWNNRFLKECRLMVFNPKSHDPLRIHKVYHIVESLTYLPRRSDDLESLLSEQKSNILYITNKNDMHILGEPSSDKPKISARKLESTSHSYFSDIFGNNDKTSDQLSLKEPEMSESDIEEEKPKESLISKKKKKNKKKLPKAVENDNQTSNNLTPASASATASNSNKVEPKNESTNLNNEKKNGHTVEFVKDKQNEPQKVTKFPNGTSTSVQVDDAVKENEQKEDKNKNVIKQSDVEILDNDKLNTPKSPKANGNGKMNGKHFIKPNSINHNETSKKRERDSSDDLTLNNTTKKRKEDSKNPAIITKNGKGKRKIKNKRKVVGS